MTLPTKLLEKRDELAKRRSSFQSSSGCKLTDQVWRRHIEIGFDDEPCGKYIDLKTNSTRKWDKTDQH